MKIITDIHYVIQACGEEAALRMAKEAGFDGVDYPLHNQDPETMVLDENYRERAGRTKELLEKYGLICNQAHAPFGKSVYGDPMDPTCVEYGLIVRAMEYASIIGAKHIVIHGIKPPARVDVTAYNVEYYKSLQPYAEKFGIQIAVENLMTILCNPITHRAVLDQLDPKWFVALLDVGHSNYAKVEPDRFIYGMDPSRLQGLHIHDNDSSWDDHLLPFLGKIRWDSVMEALAEIGYSGDLTLETGGGFLKQFPVELYPAAMAFSARVSRHLAAKMKSFKTV